MVTRGLHIGRNRITGQSVTVSWGHLAEHVLMLGKTGSGKSTLLEYWTRQLVKARRGLVLLDPEGTLFHRTLAFLYRIRFDPRRLKIIDLEETTHCPGLSYFDMRATTPDVVADLVLEAFGKIMGTDEQVKPLVEKYGRASLIPLAKAGQSLALLKSFLNDDDLREAVLQLAGDSHADLSWQAWGEKSKRRGGMDELLGIDNRADFFDTNEQLRTIVSARENCVDWSASMDAGDVVLVNLRHASRRVSRIVGIMLVHQITRAALARPEGARPFYAIVDEFAQFLTSDFRDAFKRFRKRGVHLILATQDLDDFNEDGESRALYGTALNNPATQIVFGMRNRRYCKELAEQLFAPMAMGKSIKYWGEHPVWKPVPKIESVETSSWSEGTSLAGNTTHSSEAVNLESGEIIMSHGMTLASPATSSSFSESSTTRRWTDFEEMWLKETPVFFSPDEELQHFANWIEQQTVGQCQVRYDPRKPAWPVETPAPGTAGFRVAYAKTRRVRELVEQVYHHMGLPTYVVARELLAHDRQRLLDGPAVQSTPLLPAHQTKNKGRAPE